MTRPQLLLFRYFLDELHDHLSNAGCNDFWLDREGVHLNGNDLKEALASYDAWDKEANPDGWGPRKAGDTFAPDFCVVAWLTDAISKELGE